MILYPTPNTFGLGLFLLYENKKTAPISFFNNLTNLHSQTYTNCHLIKTTLYKKLLNLIPFTKNELSKTFEVKHNKKVKPSTIVFIIRRVSYC